MFEWIVVDVYSFGFVFGLMDDYYICEGLYLRFFDKFGVYLMMFDGVLGFYFVVWVFNVWCVFVVGLFNNWDGCMYVMWFWCDIGIWEIFVFDVLVGEVYKFEIVGFDGMVLLFKVDLFVWCLEFWL